MPEKRKIVVTVDPAGNVKFEAFGYADDECLLATKNITDAFKVKSVERKQGVAHANVSERNAARDHA